MTGGNEALEKRVKELQAQYPNPTEEQQKLILEELMKLNHGAGEGVVPGDGEVKIEIEKD
jgi:hypothetical protein